LIVETSEESAEDTKKLVAETMIIEMQSLFPEVPIGVEARICTTWGGKGEIG
jgi:DNA polymerase I-like protein with 3'-5' exonuclease and polymerase domains